MNDLHSPSLKSKLKEPAFPFPDIPDDDELIGLTRHEYIAAMILQGFLANSGLPKAIIAEGKQVDDTFVYSAIRMAAKLVDAAGDYGLKS